MALVGLRTTSNRGGRVRATNARTNAKDASNTAKRTGGTGRKAGKSSGGGNS